MKLLFQDDKVISKSNDVDSKILGNISSIYLKYTKDSNQNVYSSYSTQPISHIYCTTKLNGAVREEQILIGKCSLSEEDGISVLSNFYLIDSDDEEYKENFNILGFEVEESKELTQQQLEVILCCVFACNLTSEDRVYIICDEEGNSYNSRAVDILKQVYKKLPYFMRKSIGYNTYSIGDDDASRIKLCITTRSNSNIEGAYIIDLKSSNYYDVVSGISQKIKTLVKFLLSLDENELTSIYDEIYNIYGMKNLTVDRFVTVFDYIDFYSNRDLDDEIIENYIYDIKRANEHPEQVDLKLFNKMVSDVKSKLDNKSLNNYIKNNFNNTIDLDNIDLKASNAFDFIYYLGDIFKLDIDLVENWFNKKRIPYLEDNYNSSQLVKILEADKNTVENLQNKIKIEDKDSGYKNINLIKERALNSLNKKLYELNQEFQKFIVKERNDVKNNLQGIESLETLLKTSKNITIEYSENNNYLKQEIENKFLFIINSYKGYLDLNNVNLNNMTEEQYDNLLEDIKLYYDNDKNIVQEIFGENLIEEDTQKSALDKINHKFESDSSNLELNYYNNLIKKCNNLDQIGYSFDIYVQRLKYPDRNKYELEKTLNLNFEEQLKLDNQGKIDISVDDLRNFLSKYRDFLNEDNIKLGYDCMQDKLYVKVDDTPQKVFESKLEKDTIDVIEGTIYKVANKDINRFFRSLILIQQDSTFEDRLKKAKSNYAEVEQNEHVFLLFDNTLFRTAQEGFVLTEENVYYKSVEGQVGKVLISDIESIKTLENTDCIYINDIPIRCDVVGENYRDEFKNLILSIFYLLQNVDDKNNIASVVKDVLGFQE